MKKFLMALFAAIILALSGASAAHADYRWGAGNPPNPTSCGLPSQSGDDVNWVAMPSGSNCESVSTGGNASSTYLHQANGEGWLANFYNAGGGCGSFDAWMRCTTGLWGANLYEGPHVNTVRYGNNEINAVVVKADPVSRTWCWWAARLYGNDFSINVKSGYSISGACGNY